MKNYRLVTDTDQPNF